MPDRPNTPATARGSQTTHAQPDTLTDTARPGYPTGKDQRTRRRSLATAGRALGVPTRLVGMVATLAAFAGGAVGTRELGVLLTGMVVVLIGMAVVAAVLIAGFTHAMVTLTAEGRRRARSVEDVGTLMTGAASAYGKILMQFTTLVRGFTGPSRSD